MMLILRVAGSRELDGSFVASDVMAVMMAQQVISISLVDSSCVAQLVLVLLIVTLILMSVV